jgi:hypothetical protein
MIITGDKGKNINLLIWYGIPRILFLFLLLSCSSSKTIIRTPIKEEGVDYLFNQLENNEIRYSWFSAKFAAEYTIDKKKTNFNGQIRIRKDSLIWITVSPALGIEMIRLLFTNDSVKYLNRIESQFFTGDFHYVNQVINNALDFDMLQAFFTGNDFSFYENGKFKASIDDSEYRLSTAQRQKLKRMIREKEGDAVIPFQDIWLDPQNFKITRVLIREVIEGNRKFEALYSDFVELNNQRFPTRLEFYIRAEEKSLVLTIKYSRITIDEPTNFPFTIPAKYIRIL